MKEVELVEKNQVSGPRSSSALYKVFYTFYVGSRSLRISKGSCWLHNAKDDPSLGRFEIATIDERSYIYISYRD